MIHFNPQLNQNISLYNEIHSLGKTNAEQVKQLQGTVGADIFEGKNPTISSSNHANKNIINKIKNWFAIRNKVDYKKNDSLWKIMFKYIYNNKKGNEQDIEKTFGSRGSEIFKQFKAIGYIK